MPDSPGEPVDVNVLASRGAEVSRTYGLADMPRAAPSGALEGTEISILFRFSKMPGGIGVDSEMSGAVVLTCQRCLRPVKLPIEGDSALLLVGSDAEAELAPEDREPVVIEANQLDLVWLAEEEMLLALPLVPLHEEACRAASDVEIVETEVEPPEGKRQRPFENLRDLFDKH